MGNMVFEQKELDEWIQKYPLLRKITELEPVVWLNPNLKRMNQISSLPVNKLDMEEAAQLWQRFAPFLANEFPETKATEGIIESPLRKIAQMKNELKSKYDARIVGGLYLKCDNELPIAGSIKARGGVYEQ
jgi:D-serine dehydratase